MNKGLLQYCLLLILLLLIPVCSFSQKVKNVVSEVSDNNIHIYYDLSGTDDQPVFIRVFLSTDGGKSYGQPLKSVTGDVGMVVGSGTGKKIIWNVFSEMDELVSEEIKFKVDALLLERDGQKPVLKPCYQLAFSANLGSKVELASFGFNLKAMVRLKQIGLGIRGEYYRSYGTPELADNFDNYMGFSGGAVAEYDFIRNPEYSLYPFVCLGQTKIEQQSKNGDTNYAGYSIYYSAGAGFDINLTSFLSLGVELEYIMAPVIDIDDQAGSTVVDRVVMDGLWAGICLKFIKCR